MRLMGSVEQSKLAGRHVLVLGAGYVGSAVLARLADSGARLSALTRNPETAAALRARGVRVLQADLAAEDWHGQLTEGADWVLNCVGSGGGGLEAYRHSYLGGMRSLLLWASRAPVAHILYTSSISVYAAGGGALVEETGELAADGGPSSILADAERLLLAAEQLRSRRHVLRLAGIYGPGRHRFLDQLASGEQVSGYGERHLNLIHLDDIVSAVLAVWTAPVSVANQVFNVVDDGQATRAQIATWLARRLDLPTPRFSGEVAAGRSRVPPDRIISNRLIKSLLAWAPSYPSFREGYEDLLARE
jgi:nucleoside-diphosphate-sugar epimerase